MRASKAGKLVLWLFIAVAVPISCLVKGWLSEANDRASVTALASSRATLDQRMNPEDGRRVLIGGGSNALSSFDSAYISRQIGLPVYNLGMLGEGLDVRNMFAVVEARARQGDIVVISALSFLTRRDVTANATLTKLPSGDWYLPSHGVDLSLPQGSLHIPLMSLFDELTLLNSLKTYAQWQSAAPQIESLEGFDGAEDHALHLPGNHHSVVINDQGDWIDCTQTANAKPLEFDPKLLEHSRGFTELADNFERRLNQRGVKVLFTLPTVLIREKDRSRWEAQVAAVMKRFGSASFIRPSQSWQLSSDAAQFCDTNAHMLRSNARFNSESIVSAVQLLLGVAAR
ncbi:hypothetical protein [uncultured Nevskia sp.]|uniref:hypothetical protein n=1 Tax=uncultured Nevskia sp. TaxID=228950 RepID=UPI0025D1B017|nr:hypothetical protein [uncultured Nevskia sp.]